MGRKRVRSEPSNPYDDEARWRTARARAPRQWAVFAHPKIGRRRKSGDCLGMRQKLFEKKKKQSKGERLIGEHALTTTNVVTLALIRKNSLLSNKTIIRRDNKKNFFDIFWDSKYWILLNFCIKLNILYHISNICNCAIIAIAMLKVEGF